MKGSKKPKVGDKPVTPTTYELMMPVGEHEFGSERFTPVTNPGLFSSTTVSCSLPGRTRSYR